MPVKLALRTSLSLWITLAKLVLPQLLIINLVPKTVLFVWEIHTGMKLWKNVLSVLQNPCAPLRSLSIMPQYMDVNLAQQILLSIKIPKSVFLVVLMAISIITRRWTARICVRRMNFSTKLLLNVRKFARAHTSMIK